MKKTLVLALMLVFGSVMGANAACTVEEAQAKAQTFQEVSVAAAQANPQKYLEALQAMQNDLPALQAANDADALCKFFDEWIAKLQ